MMKHIHTFESFLNESATDKAWDKFKKEKDKLFAKISIDINANVSKEDKEKFVYPFLKLSEKFPETDKGLKERIKWLSGITFINVEITNKKPQGSRVFYSGTVETDYGSEEFNDIDNGFSIGIG